MTNTAMPIPAIISSPSAPAARQSENSAPEKPFNQVLNKEVADRQQKNAVKNEAPAPSKQSEPAKQSEACADAGASAKSAAAHAGKTDKTTKENKTEEKQAAEDNACGAIPTALLEMVASLTHRPDLAQAAAPAAKSADDAISDAATDANKPDISRLAGDLHSSKGAKADIKQSADLTGDPAAAVSAHTNEPAPSLQSAKAEAVELRKAMLSATDSKPAHQSADAAVQPMVLPNLPSAGAPLVANMLAHQQPAGDRLTPAVGTPAWDQALGQKVVWMVAGAEQSASLSLNPPDLGPLQVVLNVSNAQADATFISAQPEVRQALEAALPKLRDMLNDAGIQLGQASVNAGTPQQQGDFGRPAHSSSRSSASADDADAPAAVAAPSRVSSGIGMVDTFA